MGGNSPGAILRGAIYWGAILRGAILRGAILLVPKYLIWKNNDLKLNNRI